MTELSAAQIVRQDFVDNEVFNLIQSLAPNDRQLDWDIEMIAEVREAIREQFERRGVCTEMEFYPFFELHESASSPD
jgi:hypothetical protein